MEGITRPGEGLSVEAVALHRCIEGNDGAARDVLRDLLPGELRSLRVAAWVLHDLCRELEGLPSVYAVPVPRLRRP